MAQGVYSLAGAIETCHAGLQWHRDPPALTVAHFWRAPAEDEFHDVATHGRTVHSGRPEAVYGHHAARLAVSTCVRLCGGLNDSADHLAERGCVPGQWLRAVTIQARELNQTPSSVRCAARVSRRRSTARAAAAGSSFFSTSLVHMKPPTQSRAAATSGP